MPVQSMDVSAGGAFLAGMNGFLGGAALLANAGNATLTVKEHDNSGRLLAVLGATGAGADAQFEPAEAVWFQGGIFVTVTGSPTAALIYYR